MLYKLGQKDKTIPSKERLKVLMKLEKNLLIEINEIYIKICIHTMFYDQPLYIKVYFLDSLK